MQEKIKTPYVIKGVNDLQTVNSDLANEWDYEKNGNLTPSMVCANSNKFAYWICKECGYKFKARIDTRNRQKKVACIKCINKQRSKIASSKTREDWRMQGVEEQIGTFLEKIYPDVEKQKRFRDCRGLNFGILSFDFYIPSLNLLIEYNGEQHYKPISFRKKERSELIRDYIYQLEHDERKRKYAESKGFRLLSISYTCKKYKNIGTFIKKEINKICQQ